MVDTGFFVPADKIARLAEPFETDPASGNKYPLIDVSAQPGNDSGGAGGVSTASDYLRFAQMLLEKKFPEDVQVLKVDIPSDATVDTPWQLTRVSYQRYYEPLAPDRKSWSEPGLIGYREAGQLDNEPEDTDVYVMRRKRRISVTPLSLDLTSRVDFATLNNLMRDR